MMAFRWTRERGLERRGTLGAVVAVTAVAGLVAGVVAIYLALSGGTNYDLLITFGVNAVLVVGLQVLVGNTGIMSFGQMAFVALGAYTAGLLSTPAAIKASELPNLPAILRDHTLPIVPAIVCAGLVAAIAGLLIGPILMRLTGIAAGITTFAFLVITNDFLRHAKDFTRGNETFFGVPQSANLPVVFGSLIAVVAIASVIKWSRLGLQARSAREDPLAAETAGIKLVSSRVWPWVGSAFISGVGGALLAYQLTAFSPNSFYLTQTIPIVIMVVLGGAYSVTGAVVGATLLTAWQEFVRNVENGHIGPIHIPSINGIAELSLGVGLILMLLVRPEGVMGSWEPQLLARRRGRRTQPPVDPAADESAETGTDTARAETEADANADAPPGAPIEEGNRP
ncbi:MAG TPA: branched-chain amino acid ABC transporter permease [Actinomycetota bacterium]|nr:branched-chain amino acid ABC transporter permease [Actinomycetota bacterium]